MEQFNTEIEGVFVWRIRYYGYKRNNIQILIPGLSFPWHPSFKWNLWGIPLMWYTIDSGVTTNTWNTTVNSTKVSTRPFGDNSIHCMVLLSLGPLPNLQHCCNSTTGGSLSEAFDNIEILCAHISHIPVCLMRMPFIYRYIVRAYI